MHMSFSDSPDWLATQDDARQVGEIITALTTLWETSRSTGIDSVEILLAQCLF